MRYFCFNEYDPDHEDGGYVVTWSEQDVRERYYPYWYERMCNKFGREKVDSTYSFEECLEDWIIVNWAWEVKQ